MTGVDVLIEDLVTANKILANEGVVDAFGHISVRHPDNPDRYLLARARTPQCIEASDIMEFELDGTPIDPGGRSLYLERYIHGAIYEAHHQVNCVVHSHSHSVVPFGVGGESIRPLLHNCAVIGPQVPIWDSRDKFGDTDLLVSNMTMGRDLAQFMQTCPTCLMRGHGAVVSGRSLRSAVFTAIALHTSAELQAQSSRFKTIKFLSPGEIEKIMAMFDALEAKGGGDRAWEYWCFRAGVPFRPSS